VVVAQTCAAADVCCVGGRSRAEYALAPELRSGDGTSRSRCAAEAIADTTAGVQLSVFCICFVGFFVGVTNVGLRSWLPRSLRRGMSL
jgi:hypothetical protein